MKQKKEVEIFSKGQSLIPRAVTFKLWSKIVCKLAGTAKRECQIRVQAQANIEEGRCLQMWRAGEEGPAVVRDLERFMHKKTFASSW